MKRCKHANVVYTWSEDVVGPVGARCSPAFGCGEVLSLGPANDDSEAVQIEIRAAELAVNWRENPGSDGPRRATARELWGWQDHEEVTDVADSTGWLAREIATHDEQLSNSADDRPIRAGAPEVIGMTPRQLRDTTAAAVAEEDAMRDPEVTARNAEVFAEREDDAELAADAARQAEQDGYTGPAVVVELVVGEEGVDG